jgi:dihydrofolate reductase
MAKEGFTMRRLFSFNMVTLDGFFEGPGQDIGWHNVDEEFNQFAVEQTGALGAILFGRVTYELMAGYWPTPAAQADDPEVAHLMNTLPKAVFSRTLTEVTWNNTRLIKANIAEEILKMKQEPGGDLAVFGSANLLSSLMRLNLVDEHRVMINPVLLGRGTPLFQGVSQPANLKLINTRAFRSGNILLYYQLTGGAT